MFGSRNLGCLSWLQSTQEVSGKPGTVHFAHREDLDGERLRHRQAGLSLANGGEVPNGDPQALVF